MACLLIAWPAGTTGAVNIETVRVGNPGNAGDTEVVWDGTTGYGSVGYTYNIGKYEVTAGQYTEYLNRVGGVDTYGLYHTEMANTSSGSGITRSGGGTVGNPYTYTVASSHVNRPVNWVSYWDSCRFANWLHNGQPTGNQGPGTTETGAYTLNGYNGDDGRTIQRNDGWKWAVPSEDEWYKAAYHKNDGVTGNYWDYPTSSNTAPGQDMADASGDNANCYTAPYTYPIDSPYYTTVAGEFQNSDSPYGTFDQGGNVWEWNESIVYQDATYSARGLRGGSFDECPYADSLLLAWNRTSVYNYGLRPYEYFDCGFRVSEVPEPATVLLLVFAGLGALRTRRA
ncbi:MAG TPA: SUMF1/EgtB/PvdO family nonheme iron enzyme [Candidatus Paceibacterota bacterium]|nr:SUMF1/EgtB/PvdO family nonheme iron enzyme [Candidatus Paceibacterota bacterium]